MTQEKHGAMLDRVGELAKMKVLAIAELRLAREAHRMEEEALASVSHSKVDGALRLGGVERVLTRLQRAARRQQRAIDAMARDERNLDSAIEDAARSVVSAKEECDFLDAHETIKNGDSVRLRWGTSPDESGETYEMVVVEMDDLQAVCHWRSTHFAPNRPWRKETYLLDALEKVPPA